MKRFVIIQRGKYIETDIIFEADDLNQVNEYMNKKLYRRNNLKNLIFLFSVDSHFTHRASELRGNQYTVIDTKNGVEVPKGLEVIMKNIYREKQLGLLLD